ncbi:MAG TPA: class I SAM-dependent methyltransferase [Solirubrobacterales bacterium]
MRIVWHEVECGAYEADLPLWEELADEQGDPVLELGCGAGRVALHLARRGKSVLGLDLDAELVSALNARRGVLSVEAALGNAGGFDLEREFALVLAPMQLMQLLDGEAERISCLSCIAAHLRPGGRAALAIAEEVIGSAVGITATPAPDTVVPDAREVDGWVYSSLPLQTVADRERIVVRRLRQTVSPGGELSEELDEVELRALSASTLECEAASAGLRPTARREIEPTADHVGSTVVLLERED